MANRYMHESGCTPEQMASVVTALRSWAARDPNSFFYGKDVPSVEKVLASDMLNTPLHKRESNVLGDGGCAMVIVSAEDAKKMKRPAAYKLGDSVRYFSGTCVMRDFNKVAEGFRVTAKEAMAQAGITKEDVSLWNCYLAYPLAHPMMSELLEVAPAGHGRASISLKAECPLAGISPGQPLVMRRAEDTQVQVSVRRAMWRQRDSSWARPESVRLRTANTSTRMPVEDRDSTTSPPSGERRLNNGIRYDKTHSGDTTVVGKILGGNKTGQTPYPGLQGLQIKNISIRGNSVLNAGPATWTGLRQVARRQIYTFSTAYSMVEPKFMDELPYTIAYVDLEEGIRMMTRIVDCKPEDISFDMKVEVVFHERNGYFLPYFRPAGKK